MVKLTRMIPFASVLALCVGAGSCGSSILADSPSDVVKKSLVACNDARYSEAEEYLSADVKKLIHGELGAFGGGMKGACDSVSHNGNIESIEIKSETVRGEGAVVIADIHFKDKSIKRGDSSTLVKEDGKWKLRQ